MKSEAVMDLDPCDDMHILKDDGISSLMKILEQKLQIESSEQINESMTKEELKTAGEMFIYLTSCPKLEVDMIWFKTWSSLYTDLFLTKSADQIILTLNRLMKTEIIQDKDARVRAEKLFLRTMSLMPLKYELIQRLRPEKNGYVFKDSEIRNGTHLSGV